MKSNAVTLNVQPIPATFTDLHWLAAEQIELTQTWSGDTTQMKVGELLTRTVKLVAHGSTVGQIPNTTPAKIDPQLKSYNDQPVLHEEKTLVGITASREEKLRLFPQNLAIIRCPRFKFCGSTHNHKKLKKRFYPK